MLRPAIPLRNSPCGGRSIPPAKKRKSSRRGYTRFTTVIDAGQLPELLSLPSDQLSAAQPQTIDNVVFNVRTWMAEDGTTQQVVALARDGDNLVVAPVDALLPIASIRPLDEVNAGSRAHLEVNGFRLQGRELEREGITLLPLGPRNSELTVVAPRAIAAASILALSSTLQDEGLAPFGSTELPVYTLTDHPPDELYVLLSAKSWQPIMDLEQARTAGFAVVNTALGEPEIRTINGTPDMQVATATMNDGTTREVVILVENNDRSYVMPVESATTLRLTPLGKLAQPFVANMDGMSVSYRDDYVEHDERQPVAVGERRDMSLLVPQTVIAEAYDVPSQSLSSVLVPHFSIQNYVDALSKDLGGANFFTFFRNSGLLVILNLIGHFISVTVVAYAFARLRAPGKNLLFLVLLSTMMLPFTVMLIPQFEIFQAMGMINTLWPLFIRSFFGNAFLIFLLRQFFMAIPIELEEAARIDGANTIQVLIKVILPLSLPALATVGIFTFWWTWNSFFEPYVYLSSPQNYTVSLGLAFFKGQYNTSFHLLMAASMVVILPIIAVFFFAQRYFIEGIQMTGLKG